MRPAARRPQRSVLARRDDVRDADRDARCSRARRAIEWLTHHARTPPPQLATARPELAAYPELDALLQRCLAKHREQRPGTAGELAGLLAELEPTLARSPAIAPPRTASKPTPVHASSFVEVLRDPPPPAVAAPPAGPAGADPWVTGQAPGATLAPGAPIAPGTPGAPGAPIRPSARDRRPRRLAIWLAGVAIASVVGLAIGVSVTRPGAADPPAAPVTGSPAPGATPTGGAVQPVRDEPGDLAPGARPVVAPIAAGPGSAAPEVAPAAGAPSPPPHTGKPPAPAPPRRTARPAAPRDPEIAEHLREAEDAYRNNLPPLRQFAPADLVLRADPGNARARYLAGDALIKSGDIDNGCKYLAAIKRLAIARERARAAGCPGD